MIGRAREQKELEKLYTSGRAELVAIYGKRRVGVIISWIEKLEKVRTIV